MSPGMNRTEMKTTRLTKKTVGMTSSSLSYDVDGHFSQPVSRTRRAPREFAGGAARLNRC